MNAEERKALVSLLESDDFEDATALAEAMYKKVQELLSLRESYGLKMNETGWAYGPFWDKNSAKRALKVYPFGEIHPLRAANEWTRPILEADRKTPYCHVCQHQKSAHLEGGCIVGKTITTRGTRGRACGCKEGL